MFEGRVPSSSSPPNRKIKSSKKKSSQQKKKKTNKHDQSPLLAPNCSTLELPPGEEVGMLPPNSEAGASQAILGSFESQEREAEEIRDEINRLHERLA